MPSQRLRRILKNLQQPVSESTSASTTTAVESNEDDVAAIGKKRALLTNDFTSSSNILLQAIEKRKLKKRKCAQEQSQTPTVLLRNNHVTKSNETMIDMNSKGANDTKNVICDDYGNNTNDIIQSIQELRKVYLYGLQTVSKLQDLRDAPDAILPGNFCNMPSQGGNSSSE
jgi:hypothetical protein